MSIRRRNRNRNRNPMTSPARRRLAFAVACMALFVLATTSAPAAGLPDLPGDEEPEITIIQRDRDVIEEYRIRGQLYMIRVVPHRGVPYYLVDTDGDGNLETRRNEITEDLLIPNWILFRW